MQTPSFDALLFSPDVLPGGARVSVQMTDEGVCIARSGALECTVAYGMLRLAYGGHDHDQILISWPDGTLALTEARARETFLAHAPPPLASALAGLRRERARGRKITRLGWGAMVGVLLLPVLAGLILWWQSDRIVDWAVDRVSIEAEQSLGETIYRQMVIGLTPAAPEMLVPIQEIGARLTKGSPYAFHWHVVKDTQVNAFAIPGGHVVVFTGLIAAADSAEEVAGVLAHEVQHVLKRHSLRGMIHGVGLRAVLTLLLGNWAGGAADFAAQMGSLRFGREQEQEADLEGVALLKQAQIAPGGMITFFNKLAKQEGAVIPLLSTHPASDDRAEALRAAIAQQGPWRSRPLPYDWTQIHASLRRGT